MSELRLYTSLEVFEQLHALADSSKKPVPISPDILKNLLMDHSNMFKALRERGAVKVVEPRHRERLR